MNIDKKFEVHLDFMEASRLSHMLEYAMKNSIWSNTAIDTADNFIKGTIKQTITSAREDQK